jgi:hypothetical protein
MAVASAKFEAGQALLPERAPWLADFEAELFVFPGSRHDDQCDSISQALLDKNNSFMMWLTPWTASSPKQVRRCEHLSYSDPIRASSLQAPLDQVGSD